MFTVVQSLRSRLSSWLTPTTLRIALLGGVGHAIVVVWTSAFVRQESVLDAFWPETLSAVVVLAYIAVGLVVLGALATTLLYRSRLVAPTVGLVAVFSWASYRSWQSYEAARAVGADPGVSLRPDGAYLLFWFVPLAIVCGLAVVEYGVRRCVSRFVLGRGSDGDADADR